MTGPLKASGIAVSVFEGRHFNHANAYRKLTDHFGTANLSGFGCEDLELATSAAARRWPTWRRCTRPAWAT